MKRKIIIIDDEPLIRTGLTQKIDWNQIGCEVCGAASNGNEGLQLIDRYNPHIVITDIVMPGQTGIELAKKTLFAHPRLKFIFLSAYDDFSYAQEAIRLNAFDYILKPINPKNLLDSVQKAIKEIEEEERVSKIQYN